VIISRGIKSLPMLKCSSERWVCAPHSLSAGTSTTPRLSLSFRVSAMGSLLDSILKSRRIRVNRSGAGWAPPRSRPLPSGALFRLTQRRPRSMVDFHGGCLAGGENDALGHMIDVDAHGNALGQTHPGEDRVDLRESLRAGLRIRDVDAPCNAADVAADDVAIAHELDLHRVALADGAQSCLGEVAIDPKGIGVDDADLVLPHGRVIAELRQKVGHPTVDRRADLRAPEIDLGLLALRLGLRKTRLGAGALDLQRFDLPFSQFERCLRALHRRLLFSLLSAVLLCALNGP